MGRIFGESLAVPLAENQQPNQLPDTSQVVPNLNQLNKNEFYIIRNLFKKLIGAAINTPSLDERSAIMNRIGGLAVALDLTGAEFGLVLQKLGLTRPSRQGLLHRFMDELRGCQTIDRDFMASLTKFLANPEAKPVASESAEMQPEEVTA